MPYFRILQQRTFIGTICYIIYYKDCIIFKARYNLQSLPHLALISLRIQSFWPLNWSVALDRWSHGPAVYVSLAPDTNPTLLLCSSKNFDKSLDNHKIVLVLLNLVYGDDKLYLGQRGRGSYQRMRSSNCIWIIP